MLSIPAKLARAQRFVVAIFDLEEYASSIVVRQWTIHANGKLDVLVAIGNECLVRVTVDDNGTATFTPPLP